MTWAATVLTLYPDAFPGPLGVSLIETARENGIWSLETVDIRSFSDHKHRAVDDTPAGGGPGMVMRADVLAAAIDDQGRENRRVIYLSPRGKPFDQGTAHELASDQGAVFICGRFEGVDERVLEARQVEEISLGDFVLCGGEAAAMALIEATVRLLPGVVGEAESLSSESFEDGLLEHPHYTRPRVWEGHEIPEVLLSGHHGRIEEWRRAMSETLTRQRRPDLWAGLKQKDDA